QHRAKGEEIGRFVVHHKDVDIGVFSHIYSVVTFGCVERLRRAQRPLFSIYGCWGWASINLAFAARFEFGSTNRTVLFRSGVLMSARERWFTWQSVSSTALVVNDASGS